MTTQSKEIGSLVQKMTPSERAGLFVWPSLAGPEINTEEKNLLQQYKPSGVVLFRRSLRTLAQSRELCERIREFTRAPHQPQGAVIAIDEEGGRVYRMPSPFPRLPAAATFASPAQEEDLRSQVILQTSVARSIGIDCLFAPVADVLTHAENPAIGDRAFSSDAQRVARCARIVAQEIHRAGMLSCAKHFPGHGHTATDSHKGFATTDVDLALMQSREWLPFQELITKENIPLIMTAHVLCLQIDSEKPATLSSKILQNHLRKTLGFKGLIVSDDLRMNAISDCYGVAKKVTAAAVDVGQNPDDVSDDSYLRNAACDALVAGCDILLSCQSIVREQTVLSAVEQHLLRDAGQSWCLERAERILRILGKRSAN